MTDVAITEPHVRTVHGVHYCGTRHPAIRKLDSQSRPGIFGGKLWRSSFMLMAYFEENPLEQNLSVIEVGCGWGLLGIFCAKTFGSRVLLTDKDARVFPYANANINLNDVNMETATLGFQDIKPEHLEGRDLLVGSDICFWPEMVGTLKKLIAVAMSAGVKRVIIADPGRYTFMQVARHCEQHYHTQLLERPLGDRRKRGYLLVIDSPARPVLRLAQS